MDAMTEGMKITDAGLSENERADFLDTVATGFCPECGKAVVQNARGRRKKFCSDKCRYDWKNKHPKRENWKMITLTCPVCGREFQTRVCRDATRKYCSRACANRGRAMTEEAGGQDGRENGKR